MRKFLSSIYIFVIITIFLSCASTPQPYTTQDIILQNNGNIVRYYFFTDEEALWSYCKTTLKKEFGITVSDETLNKMKNSSWIKDDDLDISVREYMTTNNYKYGLFLQTENETTNNITINRLSNIKAYEKIFKIEEVPVVETNVNTKFQPWMLLFL